MSICRIIDYTFELAQLKRKQASPNERPTFTSPTSPETNHFLHYHEKHSGNDEPAPKIWTVDNQQRPERKVENVSPIKDLSKCSTFSGKVIKVCQIWRPTSNDLLRRTKGKENVPMTRRIKTRTHPVKLARPGINPNWPGRVVNSHSAIRKITSIMVVYLSLIWWTSNAQLTCSRVCAVCHGRYSLMSNIQRCTEWWDYICYSTMTFGRYYGRKLMRCIKVWSAEKKTITVPQSLWR